MGGVIYPEGWELSTVEFIAKFIDYRGRTPTKTPNGIPLITAKNIRDGYINREPREYISESDYDDWMTRGIPKAGDVVITTEAPMGNVALVDISEKFALAQRAICLQCYEPEVGRFLHYALRSPTFQKDLTMNATGTTVSGIKAATLKSLSIPIPSSAEQKEIADRLDTLLAQVEATQARLASIPDIIKQFRQSVQAAAVSGKLTEEWRKPCPYQSINKDLTAPSCWSKCYLGDILNYVTSGSRGWAKYYSTNGSLFIRSQDISADKLIIEDAAFVDLPAKAEGTRTKVEPFDLLVTITGANVTKCALVEVDLDDAYVSQHVALIRLANSSNAKFLDLVLKAPNAGRKQLTSMAYGGGKPGLNLQNIKDVTFALPSQEEQAEIVRRVEQLFTYADNLEQQAKAAKARVDNLTQSILAKAFRGELTADWRAANPDLISGENSAAALLARIQAERATAKPRKRATKKSAT